MARHHRLLEASSRHLLHNSLATLPLSALALALRGIPISIAVAGAIAAPSAYAADAAQATPARKAYAVPAGSIGAALSEFASQAGVTVQIDSRLVEGLSTKGIHGNFTVYEGFTTLLEGTKFEIAESSPGVFLVRARAGSSTAAGEGVLPAVKVRSTTDAQVEQTNPPTTIGSKIPLTQREMPQTISVITQEQIQDQDMRTVDDAMRYAPGVITEVNQPGFTSYYSRGFPISSTQFDGVPTGIVTSGISGPTDNLAMYDRVEVLYGPAGLLNGFGGDGGVINLVRKRAPDTFMASIQASAGSYANSDVQADIGGPLNQTGTLRGRVVADEQYQHLMQDGTWQRNQQFYGTLEADLTPTTLLRFGASYTDNDGKPMYGFPNYTNYTLPDISRSAYLGPDWNSFSSQRTTAFAQIEQKLGDGWTAKLSYNYLRTTTDVLTGAIITADPTTGLSNRYSINTNDYNTQNAVDVYAAGPFQLFGRTHQLTIGANYLHINDLTNQFLINPDTGLDFEGDITAPLFDNTAYSNAFAGGPQNDIANVSTQYGIYGNARFSLADPLTLVVSGRVTWWNNDSTPSANPNDNYFGNVVLNDRLPAKFSPMAGLLYDIGQHQTVYASYSSIYLPQPGDETFSGHVINPIQGDQYEIGEKGDYFDGILSTTVALFHIREENRAMADLMHPGFDIAQGEAQSQGVELRANGRITPDWIVGAGYTYTDWRNDDDSFTSHQSFSVVTPKHLFKLWTSYKLPGGYNRWTIGGSVYATSKVFYTDSTGFLSGYTLPGGTITAGGYASFDARVAYQYDKHLSAALSVTNLFDRKYITSLTTGGLGNYYGNPRQVMLTLRYAL